MRRTSDQDRPSRCAAPRAVAVAALLLVSACGVSTAPAAAPAPPALAAGRTDTGVTLAENSGVTLVVVSLDPADVGANVLRVDLRDARGIAVAGSVRVGLSIDGAPTQLVRLAAPDRRGTVTFARPGRAALAVTVQDGPSAGASIGLALDLPAARVADGTLAAVDRAMQGLQTLRETQTLTGGGPVLVYQFQYQAPDRVRYTSTDATGAVLETRLVGRDRFDRKGDGPWTRSDLGFPEKVPYSAYARDATRARLIGREHAEGQDLLEIAFTQGADVYYRISVGAQDHLVRRYVMMARGHYMTGVYSDYDAPLAVARP